MSTHYLIDNHTPTLTDSDINEVKLPNDSGQTTVNGNFVVRIPAGVQVVDPTNLTDLLNQKYTSLLATYPGFTNILYDDLLDTTDISNVPATNLHRKLGSRGTVGLGPSGSLVSVSVDVSPTVVTQCIFVFELFTYRLTNPIAGRVDRIYEEIDDTATITAEVSADNGSNFTACPSGVLTSLSNPGSDLQIRLINPVFENGRPTVNIGSWAVIY